MKQNYDVLKWVFSENRSRYSGGGLFLLLLISVMAWMPGQDALGQGAGDVPCDGRLYFTRQLGTLTPVSAVTVSETGVVIVEDIISGFGTGVMTNATGYYNGHIYTQQWGQSPFRLIRRGLEPGDQETATVASPMPSGNQNNAAIDKNGIMYVFSGVAQSSSRLYKIDLKNWPTLTATEVVYTLTGPAHSDNRLWGDLAFDPLTNDAYAWYHPSTAAARGLYKITNIDGATPSLQRVAPNNTSTNYIIGTLFFNERGQLFGYGTPEGGSGDQNRFYYIDKTTGQVTEIGQSLNSPQSDGCECAYRLSLSLTAGDNSDGIVEVPQCGTPAEFGFNFVATNTAVGAFSGINFRFPIGARFDFALSAAEIKAYFDTQFSSDVTVTISSDVTEAEALAGNTKVLFVENISMPGAGLDARIDIPFSVKVRVAAGGDGFTDGESVGFQAQFGGLGDFYGNSENSTDPTADPVGGAAALFGKQATQVTFNKTDDCDRTISGSVWHDTNGNAVNDGEENLVTGSIVYANLVTETGFVIASVPVEDGTYEFSGLPAGTYKVILSDSEQTVGSELEDEDASLPADWLATGTHTTPDGPNSANKTNVLTVVLQDESVDGLDFGIQQPPVAESIVLPEAINPGGTGTYTLPEGSFEPSDSDGDIASITITAVPQNATSITVGTTTYFAAGSEPEGCAEDLNCATFPEAGIVVIWQGGAPALPIGVDPDGEGQVDVTIPYVTTDNAGATSTVATIEIRFLAPTYTISGSVFNDLNGDASKGGGELPVSGSSDDDEGGSVVTGGALFATLIDADDTIIETVEVQPDGTFTFTDVVAGTDYRVVLTDSQPNGPTYASNEGSLPEGWVATGTNFGGEPDTGNKTNVIILGAVSSDIENVDFGIQQPPVTENASYMLVTQPSSGATLPLNGTVETTEGLLGTPSAMDPNGSENASMTFVVTEGLTPDSAPVNGVPVLNYMSPSDSEPVEVNEDNFPNGVIEDFDPEGLSVTLNGTGYESVAFKFIVIDEAGAESNESSYTIAWSGGPLPVKWERVSVAEEAGLAFVSWSTAEESNVASFDVQHSVDARVWETVGSVAAANRDRSSYTYPHNPGRGAVHYYRIQSVDIDGSRSLSQVVSLRTTGDLAVRVYPNPVLAGELTLDVPTTGAREVKVYNMTGMQVLSTTLRNSVLNVRSLTTGQYVVQITYENGESIVKTFVVK